jgi:hypothetical protein
LCSYEAPSKHEASTKQAEHEAKQQHEDTWRLMVD